MIDTSIAEDAPFALTNSYSALVTRPIMSRLFAIPVLMWLIASRFPGHDQWAAAVFLLASLTDQVVIDLAGIPALAALPGITYQGLCW